MCANGPAIGPSVINCPVGNLSEGARLKRGRVTRREHRAVPIAIGTWYFSQKTVTVQACLPAGREGMARVFAVRVQIILSITRVAVQL